MARIAPDTVVLHGHDLSYVDKGSGPVVLFIHGILGSQRQWAHLVEMMDEDHRVLLPDLFGHGDSAKPLGDYSLSAHAAAMRDLLDQLGIDQVTLVGHSLGGGIAMQFFYLFPERVERLVLVASGGLGREVNPILRSATLPGAAQVLSVLASAPVLAHAEALGRGALLVGLAQVRERTAVGVGLLEVLPGEVGDPDRHQRDGRARHQGPAQCVAPAGHEGVEESGQRREGAEDHGRVNHESMQGQSVELHR